MKVTDKEKKEILNDLLLGKYQVIVDSKLMSWINYRSETMDKWDAFSYRIEKVDGNLYFYLNSRDPVEIVSNAILFKRKLKNL